MRKFVFALFILFGTAVGAVAALSEGVGLMIVLGGIGALVGTAFGGAITGIGSQRRRSRYEHEDGDLFSERVQEKSANYWLDHGRPTASPGLPDPDNSDLHRQDP